MNNIEIGNNEKYISTTDGGEIEEILNRLTGEAFKCTCGKTNELDRFIAYPHDGGIADKDGNKWWVYWHCPDCHYEWSWHKLIRRLDDHIIKQ